jgi:hypothetical protein
MNAYPVLKINGKWRARVSGHVIHASESPEASKAKGYDENECAAIASVLCYGIFGHDGLTPAEEMELGQSRQREWARKVKAGAMVKAPSIGTPTMAVA